MDQGLFSKGLTKWEGVIENIALKETLSQLENLLGGEPLQLLGWGNGGLAVPLTLSVNLPPLGTVDGVDIRAHEPVLLVFYPKHYPQIAPAVFTDRLDLPSKVLAHMYLPKDGKPPGFCLVKGGGGAVAEWYANKRIHDVLIRVTNWLRDAAAGILSLDGGHFDPLRDDNYTGTLIYDYDSLARLVKEKRSLLPNGNYARLQFQLQTVEKGGIQFQYVKVVPGDQLTEVELEEGKETDKEETDATRKKLYRGFLVWAESDQPIDTYDDLPRNWDDFIHQFCGKHLIDPEAVIRELLREGSYRHLCHLLIIAIKRPLPVLGFSDDIEFVHFAITLDKDSLENGKIRPAAALSSFIHAQPLTPAMAQRISGFYPTTEGLTLVAGVGALGSKIVMHLVKAGLQKIIVADGDQLLPHNLVRHGLSALYLQRNKARALAIEANLHFPEEKEEVVGMDMNADGLVTKGFKLQYQWIMDFTAATPFFHHLVNAPVSPETEVAKGYVSDGGILGILLIEGKERNPRLDDLQAMLYQQGMADEKISDWLKRESDEANNSSLITIGVGCSTDTTILSDDVVSLHAALMAGQLKNETQRKPSPFGSVILNRVHYLPFFQNTVNRLQFKPFTVMTAANDAAWQVRFAPDIIDQMTDKMQKAFPDETGGVLIGRANYKTKTIHVTDLIDAPPDSHANPVCFIRGKQGLAKAVQAVIENTGGQLGYVGEWHSHPHGPGGPSSTDLNTVAELKIDYAREMSPLPVFLVILTTEEILPFIF